LLALPLSLGAGDSKYAVVKPKPTFQFPRDHGAHPEFRTEWWYVTGWLDGPIGFQITFFRTKPDIAGDNPSAFSPRQILLAHAAIADPRQGRLAHEERAARAGFSLAQAEVTRTGVWIDDWRLEQHGDRYDYSRPQLNVSGTVNGKEATGTAWLDHEWSSAYLAPEAAGWDWCGINLFDGRALMAFQMRSKAGGIHYAPPGVVFSPVRFWKSPRTGVSYPVEMKVRAQNLDLRLVPLMDDQELDARASTGTIYWEGAVRAFDRDNEIGRGYLELTGYWKPMRL
jgi:predicted secreted hydrolase